LPASGDISKILAEFGLTQYEARLYLSASKLGAATASRLAKASGVRREEVYRTLPRLEKAGLVERVLGRPVRFKALGVDEGVSLLIKRKKEIAHRSPQHWTRPQRVELADSEV
jgi:sugar-specific transcriptional regulator TrmB